MSPSPSTDDATAEQEGGVRVLGIGEGETAGVFDALSSPTARPRALVGLSVLVLAVVIGGWVSGVGVGNADAPITANATLTLGDGEQYYPSNESVRIVVSWGAATRCGLRWSPSGNSSGGSAGRRVRAACRRSSKPGTRSRIPIS